MARKTPKIVSDALEAVGDQATFPSAYVNAKAWLDEQEAKLVDAMSEHLTQMAEELGAVANDRMDDTLKL